MTAAGNTAAVRLLNWYLKRFNRLAVDLQNEF